MFSSKIGFFARPDELTQIGTDNWIRVSAGIGARFAIREDGKLFGWGMNMFGGLGDGTTTDKSTPTQIGSSNWSSVSCAGLFALGITQSDGGLFGWGLNQNSRDMDGLNLLGDGTTVNRLTPTQIGLLTNPPSNNNITYEHSWSDVSAGSDRVHAIRSDGKLFGWGVDAGYDSSWNPKRPTQIGASNWTAISTQQLHSVAIRSDGKLFAWGWNGYGGVGNGTSDNSVAFPTQIGTSDWVSVSAGVNNYSAAIRSDGLLFTWGRNIEGTLGDGTTTDRLTPTQIGTSTWTNVSCGWQNTFAIRSDGKLFGWGYGLTPTPTQIGTDNWTAISSGVTGAGPESRDYLLAIRSDGKLFAWHNAFRS